MLKDLTRADWLTALALPPERVPAALVLYGTRNLKHHYVAHSALLTDVIEVTSPNALFEDVCIGRMGGIGVAYASVYGGPMASQITHLFGVLGTSLVVQTGTCGAMADGMGAGDLVIATAAGCGDGASACYLPGIDRIDATPDLVAQIRETTVLPTPIRAHAGPVWSTAALLAEGREDIERWYQNGYVAVDMETAATFAVAEVFGMRRIALLSVFDNPRAGEHLLLTETHKDEARA
nr:hypothetical protein [Chloroflexia bacterium]